ncbi:MAG: MerR family transcriptional regulator [Proteobacteria bacterium]|nr:MerR family transcriptional regulator [Pseudomonadota bacterium]
MTKELWTITEVSEVFEVEERFLIELEDEEIICSVCNGDTSTKLYTSSELEKLRLVKILTEDMDVNLAGVEVILRMRQSMIEMRRQFDSILENLAQELQDAFREKP